MIFDKENAGYSDFVTGKGMKMKKRIYAALLAVAVAFAMESYGQTTFESAKGKADAGVGKKSAKSVKSGKGVAKKKTRKQNQNKPLFSSRRRSKCCGCNKKGPWIFANYV